MKQAFFLGAFPVVEVGPFTIIIEVSKGVHFHISPGGFQHTTKPGDKLPLYTELTNAFPQQAPK